METHMPLPQGQQVMITLGLKDQLIDVMGRIVYTTNASGRYQNGVEFFHVSDNDKRVSTTMWRRFTNCTPGTPPNTRCRARRADRLNLQAAGRPARNGGRLPLHPAVFVVKTDDVVFA